MTYPTVNVNLTNLDVGTDNPALARTDLLDLATKFNGLRPLPADLAASSGASLVGNIHPAAGAVARTLASESQDRVSVFDFMTVAQIADVRAGTALVNVTTAIQAAINSGLPIFCPKGTYLSDGVVFPVGFDGKPDGFSFVGTNQTIFQASAATTVLFQRQLVAGNLYHGTIGPFLVKPCAAGNTSSAISVVGFQNCRFDRIRGISNGLKGFWALFNVAASPYQSYFNTFDQPALEGTKGYTKMFDFTNGGAGAVGNSNANTINQPMVFNNTDLVVILDLNNTYSTKVNDPYIEGNASGQAFVMGPGTIINGGAMEANLSDFEYGTSTNPVINSMVIGTYLGTAHNVSFGNIASGNLWLNVHEANPSTWTNYAGLGNQKVTLESVPDAPTVPSAATSSGTVTTNVITTVVSKYNNLTRNVKLLCRAAVVPVSGDFVVLTLTPPAGYTISNLSAGAIVSATGATCPTMVVNGNAIRFTAGSSTNHNVDYFVELTR